MSRSPAFAVGESSFYIFRSRFVSGLLSHGTEAGDIFSLRVGRIEFTFL